MKIVIADDHEAVRQGVRDLLEERADFEVVGEARDGIEALEKCLELEPDILITDLKMPGLDGIQVTEQVRESSPNSRVIVLSMYGSKTYVLLALSAGASGYVVKKDSTEGIVNAVLAVSEGKQYLSPGLEKML